MTGLASERRAFANSGMESRLVKFFFMSKVNLQAEFVSVKGLAMGCEERRRSRRNEKTCTNLL